MFDVFSFIVADDKCLENTTVKFYKVNLIGTMDTYLFTVMSKLIT